MHDSREIMKHLFPNFQKMLKKYLCNACIAIFGSDYNIIDNLEKSFMCTGNNRYARFKDIATTIVNYAFNVFMCEQFTEKISIYF